MRPIAVIFRKEVQDAVRSRWMVTFSLIFGLVALVLSLVQATSDSISVQGFNRTTAALTNLSLLLVPLLALVVGAGAVAGERERGSWTLLLSQPITVRQLMVGKYLGLMVAIWGTIMLGFGGAGMLVALVSPITDLSHYLVFSLLSAVLAAATLSIGMLISVFSDTRLKASSQALIVWFVFVVMYDLAAVGVALSLSASGRALLIAVMANPVESIRIFFIMSLEPDLDVLGPLGSYVINEVGHTTAIGLLSTMLALWIVLPLTAAISIAQSHDG